MKKESNSRYLNKFIYIAFILIFQTTITFIFLRYIAIQDAKHSLEELYTRISNDLQIKNGKWDTTLYNADPHTPHPSGSNGFITPLYIITSGGFVIERNQPISGLLDSSDFKHLQAFQTPQTLAVVTNDQWRVLSKPILGKNNEVLGLTSVAYHNPNENILNVIDSTLLESLEKINSAIKVTNNSIDVKDVDIRTIRYDIAFEVINTYNKVLLQNGRTPTYIDPSYIDSELKRSITRIVRDSHTGEQFLIYMQPIKDSNGKSQGIILIGRSLYSIHNTLRAYVIFSLGFGIFLIIPLLLLLSQRLFIFKTKSVNVDSYPEEVAFDSKESVILADKKIIAIPYATNQYYLCKAVFSHPKKRWELDELLKKFGDQDSSQNWRKVYDAAIMVNKKAGFKLISYQDKTFRLNPAINSSS